MAHDFKFRWNDHVPHLSQIFSDLRGEEVYCDTTLVSDDGYVVKAHGAVLSAASHYFERVLANVTSDQHPIIVLKGANFVELSCLLDYIYQGATQVDHQLMKSVLDVADILEVKGLSKLKDNISIRKLITPLSHSSYDKSGNTLPCHSPPRSPASPIHSPKPFYPSFTGDPASPLSVKLDDTDTNDDENILDGKSSSPRLKSISEKNYSKSSKCLLATSSKEYHDQNLGIDLTVSKSSDLGEASQGDFKSSEVCESELRSLKRRKQMVEESIPLKKYLSKSVMKRKSAAGFEEQHVPNPYLNLEKISSLLSKRKADLTNTDCSSTNVGVSLKRNLKASLNRQSSQAPLSSDPDSRVEVLCNDGALTISVTTDPSSTVPQASNSVKHSNASVSLSMKHSMTSSPEKVQSVVKLEEESKSRYHRRKSKPKYVPKLKNDLNEKELSGFDSNPDGIFILKGNSSEVFYDKDALATDNGCKNELDSSSSSKLNTRGRYPQRIPRKSSTELEGARQCISPHTLYSLPPIKEREKQTRTCLSVEEKIKVIDAFLEGKSQRQIAHMHRIGKTQVNNIVKKREEILALYRDSLVRGEKVSMKRHRKSEYAALNENLLKWYKHMTNVVGIKISTGMLRAKALQIAPQLGYQDFKASNGWLTTFKANNKLKLTKIKDQKSSYTEETCNESDSQKETDYFEEEADGEESIDVNTTASTDQTSEEPADSSNSNGNLHPINVNTVSMTRGDSEPIAESSQPNTFNNITISNPLLTSSTPLPKPQMGNVALTSNIAYNLSREHSRTSDIAHLSELHSAHSVSTVNVPSAPHHPLSHSSHPPLAKVPDVPHSYKTEDTLGYGYDTQGRMNEGSSRGSDYNYSHYGFPGTYYGYHFLGQY